MRFLNFGSLNLDTVYQVPRNFRAARASICYPEAEFVLALGEDGAFLAAQSRRFSAQPARWRRSIPLGPEIRLPAGRLLGKRPFGGEIPANGGHTDGIQAVVLGCLMWEKGLCLTSERLRSEGKEGSCIIFLFAY